MEQAFKRNYLQHALAVKAWLQANQAQGSVDAATLGLSVNHRGRTRNFLPQFMTGKGDALSYVLQLQPGVNGFVGWLPGPVRGWPAAQSKLAFKAFAKAAGLATPAWTLDLAQAKGAFVVKQDKSSFGNGLQGPFYASPPPAAQPDLVLPPGAYVEQFVVGQLIKAWYWNGALVVAEVVPMPSLRGDGRSSLKELLVLRLGAHGAWTHVHTAVVALWGLVPAFVPPEGKDVVVDYRYLSDLNPAIHTDCNAAGQIKGTPLQAQLVQAGQAMNQVVGPAIASGYAMTLDAVLDVSGTVQFLEANCNPLLHPAFYPSMLDEIFKL